MNRIYLDNLSTTPTDRRVAEAVQRYMCDEFGNSSSADHCFGDAAAEAVALSVSTLRDAVHATDSRVYFTSGATESVNLALQGLAKSPVFRQQRLRVLTTPVEHPAVLNTCAELVRAGLVEVRMLHVDRCAQIDLGEVEELTRRSDIVVVMGANNEVGTIYPVDNISEICSRESRLFLCDATQSFGKIPIRANEVTLVACSAHKIYGPKGVGALVVPQRLQLSPLMFGGGQQRGIRPGTLNVPGIVGFAEATRLRLVEMEADELRVLSLKHHLHERLTDLVPGVIANGNRQSQLPGCLHVSFPKIHADALVARIRDQVAVSTGAACSSGAIGPSPVLTAMGLELDLIEGAVRIGLGKFTTQEEVNVAADYVAQAYWSIQRLG